MIVAPATWKAPVVDATPEAPTYKVKLVICTLYVDNAAPM